MKVYDTLHCIRELCEAYQDVIPLYLDNLQNLPEKCSPAHLQRLCGEIIDNGDAYPVDKMGRWLGFVEGVLAARAVIQYTFEPSLPSAGKKAHSVKAGEAIRVLFGRYQPLFVEHEQRLNQLPPGCHAEDLLLICRTATEQSQSYRFEQISGWLGFVQGILASQSMIDVDVEREFSRPILHAIHHEAIPSFGG